MAGCLVLGNSSFTPMYEFLTPATPKHQFGSLRETVEYEPGEKQWLMEVAKATLPLFQDPAMQQKTFITRLCHRETVWKNQFFPILQEANLRSRNRIEVS